MLRELDGAIRRLLLKLISAWRVVLSDVQQAVEDIRRATAGGGEEDEDEWE